MRPGPVFAGTIARTLILGVALATTAGCVRFGAKPPQRLFAIASNVPSVTGQPLSGSTEDALYVEMPLSAKAITTQRVAVRADATSYAYVKKALWVDLPVRQFQSLLSETISARAGKLVLNPGQYPAKIGHILHGELAEFEVDARKRQAVVTYDASLLSADGQTLRHQRFTATKPLRAIEGDAVAPAISDAANEVAAAVADWIKAGI